jgi:hypothetical protein
MHSSQHILNKHLVTVAVIIFAIAAGILLGVYQSKISKALTPFGTKVRK